MKDKFWNIVPKPPKVIGFIFIVLGILIGVGFGVRDGFDVGRFPKLIQPLGAGLLGLLFGCMVALWILCLGYVYADSRRRAMPAVPWTLIAMMVPNLLGFLFYFALRRPLTSPCPQCGQALHPAQRFCAACGSDKLSSTSGSVPPQVVQAGRDSTAI